MPTSRIGLKSTFSAECELQLTARHAQKLGLLSYCSNAASADFWTRESWLKDCLRQSNKLTLSSGPKAGSAAGVGIAIGDGQVFQQACSRGRCRFSQAECADTAIQAGHGLQCKKHHGVCEPKQEFECTRGCSRVSSSACD